ncbi:hypothetical protein LDENG_00226940 [Lucifuga dentata]|nr:hypothetical protein LDENG_00226940 [Lucifuga dentata]
MPSNATADSLCAPDDRICVIRYYDPAVIIVPTLLIVGTLVPLLALCFLRYCPEHRRGRTTAPLRYQNSPHRHTHRHDYRRDLRGIDGEQPCTRACILYDLKIKLSIFICFFLV